MVYGDAHTSTYDAISIRNVMCDNVKVYGESYNKRYMVSIGFCRNSGIEGLLLSEIKSRHQNVTCRIESPALYKTRCTSKVSIDCKVYNHCDRMVKAPQGSLTNNVKLKAGLHPIADILKFNPTFHATCDVTFNRVTVGTRYIDDTPTVYVSYSEITVIITSNLWAFSFNPQDVGSNREVSEYDVKLAADFEKWRSEL